MVDTNRPEGTLRNLGCKVQDAVGGLTGDGATQAKGKANEAAGSAQDMYGRAVDEVGSLVSEQPMMAMFAALGVGMILGFLVARRRT